MKLETHELLEIKGGAITAALITSIIKAFTTIMDFGRKVGSSIRRGINKNYC